MKLSMLLRHFSEARAHVELGAQHIAEQEQRIAELVRDGQDATRAEEFLATFRESQQLHEMDLARITAEIGQLRRTG